MDIFLRARWRRVISVWLNYVGLGVLFLFFLFYSEAPNFIFPVFAVIYFMMGAMLFYGSKMYLKAVYFYLLVKVPDVKSVA